MGSNQSGQLGDGTCVDSASPRKVAEGVVAAGAETEQSLYLMGDGSLWSAGLVGANLSSTVPRRLATRVRAFAAGGDHVLFVDWDGVLWAVGGNDCGQLGDGSTVGRSSAVEIASGVRAVSAGFKFSLFLREDGTLWGMGDNSDGELGDGTTTARSVPLPIADNVRAIEAGYNSTYYIRSDGGAWATGNNWAGKLGDGTTRSRSTPALVRSDVSEIFGGARGALFLMPGGDLWTAGDSGATGTSTLSPQKVLSGIVAAATSSNHALLIDSSGRVLAIGSNLCGALGQPTGARITPSKVADDVVRVSANDNHTMLVKQDGSLWGMGDTYAGKRGAFTGSDPIARVSGATVVAEVATGTQHTLYLETDGTLWGMGSNASGQIGGSDDYSVYTPFQVAPGVSAMAANDLQSLFVKSDRTLWASGYNYFGELGDGTTTLRAAPVKVADEVRMAATRYSNTLFVKTDGTLWGVGSNGYHQLGPGSDVNVLTPIQLATNVSTAATGTCSTFFISDEATLWAMGENTSGELGDGTTISRSVPVRIASGVAGVSSCSGATSFVKIDGTLWAMGENAVGQLGDGSRTDRVSPVLVATGVESVSVAQQALFFIKKDRTLWSVGSNPYGRLGVQTVLTVSTPTEIVLGAPVVNALSVPVTANLGGAVKLSVEASGEGGLRYQWRLNGAAIAGATDASYLIGIVQSQDGGVYDVVVTSDRGSTTSSSGQLTILNAPPVVTSSLSATARVGFSFEYRIVANNDASQFSADGLPTGLSIDGATGRISGMPDDSAGNYSVILRAGNGAGSAQAVLQLALETPAKIVTRPADCSVSIGGTASFTVTSSGSPPPALVWQVSTDGGQHWSDLTNGSGYSGVTTATLTITGAPVSMRGYQYRCVATNIAGTAISDPATLTVNVPPSIGTDPVSQTITANGSASFTATAAGTPAPNLQWQVSADGSTWTDIVDGGDYSGATTTTLTITAATVAVHGFQYRCVAANPAGAASSNPATLNVNGPPLVSVGPVGLTDLEGIPVTLTVAACGPSLSYQWRLNGVALAGATSASFRVGGLRAGDNYDVVVTNAFGSTTSVPAVFSAGGGYAFQTLAGQEGTTGYGDGLGAAALFNFPTAICIDPNGDALVADINNHVVRKVTLGGRVSTYAGIPGQSGATDGPLDRAKLSFPVAIAVAADGTRYVATFDSLRKISAAGVVSTIPCGSGEHAAGVAVDLAGNVYLSFETDAVILKVTPVGAVSTFAGEKGQPGYQDGVGAAARFARPCGIAVDAGGNVFVVDSGNSVIRKITPAGFVTTVAGTPGQTGSADGVARGATFANPQGIAVDSSGTLFVADSSSGIRKITPDGIVTTVADVFPSFGTGTGDSTRLASKFIYPEAVAIDAAGRLWVVDEIDQVVRIGVPVLAPEITSAPVGQVVAEGASVTMTVRASVASGSLSYQWCLNGKPLRDEAGITGANTDTISLMNVGAMHGGSYTAVVTRSIDGIANAGVTTSPGATLTVTVPPQITRQPLGQTVMSGQPVALVVEAIGSGLRFQWRRNGQAISGANLSVYSVYNPAEAGSYDVVVSNDYGTVTSAAAELSPDSGFEFRVLAGVTGANGYLDGPALSARFNRPGPVAIDPDGNLYVVDASSVVIRKIARDHTVSTLAGTPGTATQVDGIGAAASFYHIAAIACDGSGAIYVGDSATIRKVMPDGHATTLATIGEFIEGVAVDGAGNVFFTVRHMVKKLSPEGVVSFVAGSSHPGHVDGVGPAARFNEPRGLAVDASGTIYVAEEGSGTIRKIDAAGVVTTFAGWPGMGDLDGVADYARFWYPSCVAVDAGGMVYAGGGTGRIKKISPDGIVSTVLAPLTYAGGLTVDGAGNLYVSDASEHSIGIGFAPLITAGPADIAVTTGGVVSLTVGASSAATLRWQVSTDSGSSWNDVTDDAMYSGATTATLTITGATVSMRGYQYRCVATNVAGAVTTDPATLTVNVPSSIATGPQNQTVTAGSSASFTASVGGTPAPTLQWQVSTDGSAWTDISDDATYSGATKGTLTITAATAAMRGYQYRCVAANVAGAATTAPATLAVNVPPAIAASPVLQTVTAGRDASFSAGVSGTPAPTLQWQVSTDDGLHWSDLANGNGYSGVATATLSITSATASMRGYQYRCVATNIAGSATTDPATLTVDVPPVVSVNPVDASVVVGGSVSFTTAFTGTPTPTYRWQVSVDSAQTWSNLSDAGIYNGSETASLTITDVPVSVSGYRYRCVATNSAGAAESYSAPLIVQYSYTSIDEQATSQATYIGGHATFTVRFSGLPAPTYQWEVSTDFTQTWSDLTDGGVYSGTRTATLTITGATSAMNGYYYRCVATNMFNSSDSAARMLTVTPPDAAAAIATQPADTVVSAGARTTFVVAVTGYPAPSLQWQVSTDGGQHWTNVPDGAVYSGAHLPTLTLISAVASMRGYQYRCFASNNVGSDTSHAATLTVNSAPEFSLSPAGASVVVGGDASFAVEATGDPAPTLQWQVSADSAKTWSDLSDGGAFSGTRSATLTLTGVTVSMSGDRYRCVATNSAGITNSDSAPLTVQYSYTSIVDQPTDQAVVVGANATFTVRFSGLPAPTYQWQVSTDFTQTWSDLTDGGVYSGTRTATLMITGATSAMNGHYYRCVATNMFNSSDSAGRMLTVSPSGFAGSYFGTFADGGGEWALFVNPDGSGTYIAYLSGRKSAVVAHVTVAADGTFTIDGTEIIGQSTSRTIRAMSLGGSSGQRSVATVPGHYTLTGRIDGGSVSGQLSGLGAAVTVAGSADTTAGSAPSGYFASDEVGSSGATYAIVAPSGRALVVATSPTVIEAATGTVSATGQLTATTEAGGQIVASLASSTQSVAAIVTPAGSSTPITFGLPAAVPVSGTATHTLSAAGFTAGSTFTVSNTISFLGTPTSLSWQVLLPAGWSFVSSTGSGATTVPAAGETDTIEWAWSAAPANPLTFTYTVAVPATATEAEQLAAIVNLQGATTAEVLVRPDPLIVNASIVFHSADTNHDWKLSLLELARVIELYNTRNGGSRTGGYAVQDGTEDGFAPDASRSASGTATLTRYHSADTNRDGRLSLLELARVIELYNQRTGSTRTGLYHHQSGTEDGFSPGQ